MNGMNPNYMWPTFAFSGNIWPIQSVTEVYILTSPQLDDDLTALLGQYRSRKSSSEIKRVSCSCIYIYTPPPCRYPLFNTAHIGCPKSGLFS